MIERPPSIRQLMKYIDYCYTSFTPYDNDDVTIYLYKKYNSVHWSIGPKGKYKDFKIHDAKNVFNENKLDLSQVHQFLYSKAQEEAFFHKRAYEKGIKLLGEEAIENEKKNWDNFGKELSNAINTIFKEEDKKEKKKTFSLIRGGEEE